MVQLETAVTLPPDVRSGSYFTGDQVQASSVDNHKYNILSKYNILTLP